MKYYVNTMIQMNKKNKKKIKKIIKIRKINEVIEENEIVIKKPWLYFIRNSNNEYFRNKNKHFIFKKLENNC